MSKQNDNKQELQELCNKVCVMIKNGQTDECLKIVEKAMSDYPDAPEPHNLYGVLIAGNGNTEEALKHFRAAWSLDPSYSPANKNIELLGNYFESPKNILDTGCSCKKEN